MTYTGNYIVPYSCFQQPLPTVSLPFPVSTYLQHQALGMGNTAPPQFATTTTHQPQFPLYMQMPQLPQYHQAQSHAHYGHRQHDPNILPYTDPNLPTMRQMKLEFHIF